MTELAAMPLSMQQNTRRRAAPKDAFDSLAWSTYMHVFPPAVRVLVCPHDFLPCRAVAQLFIELTSKKNYQTLLFYDRGQGEQETWGHDLQERLQALGSCEVRVLLLSPMLLGFCAKQVTRLARCQVECAVTVTVLPGEQEKMAKNFPDFNYMTDGAATSMLKWARLTVDSPRQRELVALVDARSCGSNTMPVLSVFAAVRPHEWRDIWSCESKETAKSLAAKGLRILKSVDPELERLQPLFFKIPHKGWGLCVRFSRSFCAYAHHWLAERYRTHRGQPVLCTVILKTVPKRYVYISVRSSEGVDAQNVLRARQIEPKHGTPDSAVGTTAQMGFNWQTAAKPKA